MTTRLVTVNEQGSIIDVIEDEAIVSAFLLSNIDLGGNPFTTSRKERLQLSHSGDGNNVEISRLLTATDNEMVTLHTTTED